MLLAHLMKSLKTVKVKAQNHSARRDKKLLRLRASAFIQKTRLIYLALLLAGCTAARPSTPQKVVVFAAASLTNAFQELGAAYEAQHPEVTLVFNFGGSSQLATQLAEGAAADVFAPANEQQMATAVAANRIAPTAPLIFTTNHLTVLVPADNPARIMALADLRRPGVKLLLAAPGVPARQYTDEMIASLGTDFAQDFYANLVSEEANVRQVAAKIALGEADAGIVYASDVTPDIAARVRQVDIPTANNITAAYPIAPLLDAPQPEQAQLFIEFVRSQAGQDILARWGFGE